MMETSKERVKLLKAGFNSKMIEDLYIEGNRIKLIKFPAHIDLVEVDFNLYDMKSQASKGGRIQNLEKTHVSALKDQFFYGFV